MSNILALHSIGHNMGTTLLKQETEFTTLSKIHEAMKL